MPIKNHSRTALACAVAFALPACQTTPPATSPPAPVVSSGPRPSSSVSPALAEAAARATSPDDRATIYKGSGVVVKGQQPGGTPPPAPAQVTGAGVVLNFEGADLREVV